MSEKDSRVLDVLMYEGVIPHQGTFQVTETHLEQFISCYGSMFNDVNARKKKKFQKRFARKLAGLSFLKLNLERGAKPKDIECGIVYLIENPAWPNFHKVGMTVDLNKRINTYQTCDPHKAFKVAYYIFVMNRKTTEQKMLNSFHIDVYNGEWVNKENAVEMLLSL